MGDEKKQQKQAAQAAPSDFNDRVSKLEEELKQLALTIDKVEDEKLEITNQLKKALSDYQNLERSISNRLEIMVMQTKKQLAFSIIAVLDDLKFAIEASKGLQATDEVRAWIDGVLASLAKLEKALHEIGVAVIAPNKGEAYNSSWHEAVSVSPEGEPDTIFEIVQNGYQIGENVIRPARVVVSKKV